MDIEVRTDYHVKGDETLVSFVKDEVTAGLDAFASRITSAEVHLEVESGARKGPLDIRCMIEVRPAGRAPVVVTHDAATKDDALQGAIDDMHEVLVRLFGRLDSRHPGAESIRHGAGQRTRTSSTRKTT